MLEFIQLTEEGNEIHISKIAEIMRCSVDQAEELLTALLVKNSLMGVYDKSNKRYSKGTNINEYLSKMLEDAKRFNDET